MNRRAELAVLAFLLITFTTLACSRSMNGPQSSTASPPNSPQPVSAPASSPLSAAQTGASPQSAPAEPQPERAPGDPLCVAGHVVSTGDSSAAALADAPRRFAFAIERDDGGDIEVRYTAYPPGPVPRPKPELEFHGGEVKAGDYLKACGQLSNDGALLVSESDHSVHTYATTRVLAVRHAEKASADTNTNLDPDPGHTGIGVSRAAALTPIAVAAGVTAIYTTEFCRTAQTVQPSAQALGLHLKVLADEVAASTLTGCNPAIIVPKDGVAIPLDDPAALAAEIRTAHEGKTVLVAGHSNTVPLIVEALAGESPCPRFLDPANGACQIPEDRFGDLFIISIPPAPGRVRVTLNHF